MLVVPCRTGATELELGAGFSTVVTEPTCVLVRSEELLNVRARCTADWIGWRSDWAAVEIKPKAERPACPES